MRDSSRGVEVLLLRRNSNLAFHGGAWVFPGGRVDPCDVREDGEIHAARRAATREAAEEAGVEIDDGSLVPLAHWTTPEGRPRRFATWFFAALADSAAVDIDGAEIHDHAWFTPADAIEAHKRGEIELPPPTFVTLTTLGAYREASAALRCIAADEPTVFVPRIAEIDGSACALYPGDAGWESGDPRRKGARHRLLMSADEWRYYRDESTGTPPAGARPAGFVVRPDGTRIAYDVAGSGPAAILLHGLTSSRQAWEPVTALLRSQFTCVRLDFRGHGESSTAPAYDLLSLVGDVHAVAEHLSLTGPAVVGHSLGATVAALYAAVHDARAVVCVDQGLRFGDFAARIQPLAVDLHGDRPMEAVMEFERGLVLEPYAGIAELEERVLAFDPAIVLGLWERALDTPPEELTAVSEALLPQIDAPLLCLHGSPPPADYADWLGALVPGARVEVWEGTGHLLHLVDPERFAGRVAHFVGP